VSTGLWNDPNTPKSGFFCERIEDIGSATHTCQMCQRARVRFVHHMRHPGYRPLRTGCCCAGHLESNVAAARSREDVFRLRQARRARWSDKEWRRAKSGVSYLNADGVSIRIYSVQNGFSGVISSLIEDWRIVGKRVFPSEEAAQQAAVKYLFAKRPETAVSK
jgi:DNA helicase-2/ATP-dependent DNA helicase PcrA